MVKVGLVFDVSLSFTAIGELGWVEAHQIRNEVIARLQGVTPRYGKGEELEVTIQQKWEVQRVR